MSRDLLKMSSRILGITQKRSTVKKGKSFELAVRRILERRGCRNFERPRDRHCDWVCEDRHGNKVYVECKASPKARFSQAEVAYLLEKSKKHKVLIAFKDDKGRTQIVSPQKYFQLMKTIKRKRRKTKSKVRTQDILGFKPPEIKLW